MIGIYFSGTGNSRHALEVFLRRCDAGAAAFSIEDDRSVAEIKAHNEIVFSYPVQYSTVPKILRDFIADNKALWKHKKIFIIATMGLFSGDGSGVLARLLYSHGAEIVGGLHLKMPDSIGDEKVLKRSLEKNIRLVRLAENKAKAAADGLKAGRPPQEGLGFLSRMAGFWGQRLYFGWKTARYSNRLRIDHNKCIACGKCAGICPMNNIEQAENCYAAGGRCTMCYRCVNSCPRQAITLLGKAVAEQSVIEKYL